MAKPSTMLLTIFGDGVLIMSVPGAKIKTCFLVKKLNLKGTGFLVGVLKFNLLQ